MAKKPLILKTKAKVVRLALENKAIFSCEYTCLAPYYYKGTFMIDKTKYRFFLQNYIRNPQVINYIDIDDMEYKTIFPKQIKAMLASAEERIACKKKN